ncbi:MAG TPA: MaoC/PaaZ C-terminal domain-containing protein [Stackebrandtia sp.]|jgi:acyl dehydratase|uniref:MaoC/PaaZ C-terminal domain-containing protein n=1 Tax=Stackebrandtia sp. TaxID=2023065 RepID=UPI002D6DAC37|nr:MaoC/PaaZ C-terminal domain-containing protein [Stackebrandtia sp.]HZE41148.1 MaoC/PaaZ C-terminal domain-containing protein [Stackebrandtia sp.]
MNPGDTLFDAEYRVRRADLAAYAKASGDTNPIHLDDAAAKAAGLPGVIAHGMYTMGLAARALEDWAGDADRIRDFTARFAKTVPVPPGDEGAAVSVAGTVRKVRDDGSIEVNLTVTCGEDKVLAPARAVVRPS